MAGMGRMRFGMMRQVHEMGSVESEYEYLVKMIPHHREAVENAELLREQTDRRQMRTFASQIIETQSREIEQMEAWLNAWYPDRSHEAEYEPMMGDYEGVTGEELDLLFLQEMIPHHMAAVMMSQQLIVRDLAENRELVGFAVSIRDNQLAEIEQMSRWLDRWAE